MVVEIFNLIGREFKSSNITSAVPPNLIPLNQIMIPLIILTNIYEPINNTCIKVYTVASIIALNTEKIVDEQYPSIIIRVDSSRLSPIRIIVGRNPATPRTRIDPEDILTSLTPGPATYKIPSWISKLAVNIAVKEYSENDVVAPLIWV